MWYLISGGAGAPYYAEETTPWTAWWRERQKKSGKDRHGFVSSSQENVLIFTADEKALRFEALNPFGETIDSGRIR